MSILFYSRPDYVERPSGPLNKTECQRYAEKTKGRKDAIPPELSFDNIIANKALPPCGLSDFMDYLVYVAHDAENLQFYMWLEDYKKRFDALKPKDRALSPEWNPMDGTQDPDQESERPALGHRKSKSSFLITTRAIDVDNSGDGRPIKLGDLTALPSRPISGNGATLSRAASRTDFETFIARSLQNSKSVDELAEDANTSAGLKWQPFSCQPFRPEIARIVAHYIAPGATRELNLSYRDRSAVLHALQHTTHPSAFQVVADMVELTLRNQLHPNFVRWSICNGNKPRVFFVRTMAGSHVVLGLIIAILFTLSSLSRWFRIINAPITFLGMSGLIAAYKGLCVILHRGHGRALKPWEQDLMLRPQDTKTSSRTSLRDEESTIGSADIHASPDALKDVTRPRPRTLDTFGSANSFEGEPWVEEYRKKPMIKKVFDTSTWVQEESLRVIQDKIVRQSQAWAAIYTTVLTIFFVALPKGNLY